MKGFPPVRHIRKGKRWFAEIEGERFEMRCINGMWYFAEPDLIKLIEKYAPEEDREAILAGIRELSARAVGGSGSLQ